MDSNAFIERLLGLAAKAGFSQAQARFTQDKNFKLTVSRGELEEYAVSATHGISFQGLYGGKMGYASSESLEEDALYMLIESARVGAQLVDSPEQDLLYPGGVAYPELELFNPALSNTSAAERIDFILALYAAASAHPDVQSVSYCQFSLFERSRSVINSLGLSAQTRSNGALCYVMPLVRDGSEAKSGLSLAFSRDFGALNAQSMGQEAIEQALSKRGARPVKSGRFAAVLAPEAAIDLLDGFSDVFSAERAQKKLSLLAGREGELIAAPCVTLIDDAHMESLAESAPFDTDGVATRKKRVVDNGQLTTLLHTLKTAHAAGTEPTGNAHGISAAPYNFHFAPGDDAPAALMRDAQNGLLISRIAGSSAGINAVSGDFSLPVEGFEISGGQIGRPVDQITIAGNFFELLKRIQAVGNDLTFMGGSGSPSLLVEGIEVAGA